jgi:hypothetical protein
MRVEFLQGCLVARLELANVLLVVQQTTVCQAHAIMDLGHSHMELLHLVVVVEEISVPNTGLNPIWPDGGCPMQTGTSHGRPGRAPG